MSTTYYLRLKDDKELNKCRKLIQREVDFINKKLEEITLHLGTTISGIGEQIVNKDEFNRYFCSKAGYYGGYTDEPRRISF